MTAYRPLLRFSPLAVLIVLSCLLAGCGGGGGGGAGLAILYQTDWTNRGSNITGLSQRVRVLDAQERLLKSVTVNQDADGLQQVTLNGIGAGMKHLSIELFSARDLGGIKTGELDAWINVNGAVTFLSGVGDTPTGVKVTPEAATMQVDTTKQFYAHLISAPNRACFAAAGTFSWQTFGGVATVNNDGVVLATAAGSGNVRATHNPTGFNGGSALTVDAFQTTQSKWTVMVYMNAANDLSVFSMLNMDQMEKVANLPANCRFVVQWKQSAALPYTHFFDGTRRYLAKPNVADGSIDSELVQDMGAGVDMGDKDTLTDFIQWSRTHYPADRYVLVIWNHGNGWLNRRPEHAAPTRAVSYDDETGNFIRTHELAQAIGSPQLDIVAWDASLMQMIEVAYEIKDQAKFVVGSEESPPGEGYPYDLIFDDFRDTPDATTSLLTKAFVDGMLAVPGYASRKITQSSIETSQLDGLVNAIDNLGDELLNVYGNNPEQWTGQGYSPLASAHDNTVGTSATNPAPQAGDHVTVTFSQRQVNQVRVIVNAASANSGSLQVQETNGSWTTELPTINPGTNTVTVNRQLIGARVFHAGPGASSSIAELDIITPITNVRSMAQAYSESASMNRHFRDLFHLCQLLESQLSSETAIVNAAIAVRAAMGNAIVWEGHNGNSPNSHGISIDFSSGEDFTVGSNDSDYALLRFATVTSWNEWLSVAP